MPTFFKKKFYCHYKLIYNEIQGALFWIQNELITGCWTAHVRAPPSSQQPVKLVNLIGSTWPFTPTTVANPHHKSSFQPTLLTHRHDLQHFCKWCYFHFWKTILSSFWKISHALLPPLLQLTARTALSPNGKWRFFQVYPDLCGNAKAMPIPKAYPLSAHMHTHEKSQPFL